MPNSLQIPPYRAALLTGADGAPVIRSNGPDSELVMTERQWYMFWQNLAGQVTANVQTLEGLGNIATYGNHADRPDPGPWPDGALYVEQDRGSVLYQNQGGIWVYIAGQMFGTLSPDQRPTDLGPAADVGFLFRTSVDPARSFAWNGGQWVETTPARYGTHAERLAAPIAELVSGMLWMETDRGSVIYQNQGGTWLFLTGTMWGTLVPDQRPTDLGVHDAGFDFRSTVAPPREFIWNQTAWVEVTALVDPTTTKGDVIARGTSAPATRLAVGADGQVLTADAASALGVKWGTPTPAAANTVQFVMANAQLSLTTVAQDIPGVAITVTRNGQYLAIATISFQQFGGDTGSVFFGGVLVGGSAPGGSLVFRCGNGTGNTVGGGTVSQTLGFTASAGQVVKLQASKNTGSGGSVTDAFHTTLSVVWIAP